MEKAIQEKTIKFIEKEISLYLGVYACHIKDAFEEDDPVRTIREKLDILFYIKNLVLFHNDAEVNND